MMRWPLAVGWGTVTLTKSATRGEALAALGEADVDPGACTESTLGAQRVGRWPRPSADAAGGCVDPERRDRDRDRQLAEVVVGDQRVVQHAVAVVDPDQRPSVVSRMSPSAKVPVQLVASASRDRLGPSWFSSRSAGSAMPSGPPPSSMVVLGQPLSPPSSRWSAVAEAVGAAATAPTTATPAAPARTAPPRSRGGGRPGPGRTRRGGERSAPAGPSFVGE